MVDVEHSDSVAVLPAQAARQKRVLMIYPPRSTSSIFTRCLSGVPKTEVVFDAYSLSFEAENNLRSSGKVVDYEADDLPDSDWQKALETLVGEDCSGADVNCLKYPDIKRLLDSPSPDKDFVVCKSVAMAFTDHFEYLPNKSSNYKYTILLRHPIKVFKSWRTGMYDLVKNVYSSSDDPRNAVGVKSLEEFHFMRDVPKRFAFPGRFFKELYDVWMYVKKNLDPNPIVIDSDDLLSDPAGMLAKYCAAVGIAYSDDLLKWDGKPESTNHWKCALSPLNHYAAGRIFYNTALYSTHFLPPSPLPSIKDVTDDVRESVEFVMPYYQEMYAARILP